jgi:hypothetical protein
VLADHLPVTFFETWVGGVAEDCTGVEPPLGENGMRYWFKVRWEDEDLNMDGFSDHSVLMTITSNLSGISEGNPKIDYVAFNWNPNAADYSVIDDPGPSVSDGIVTFTHLSGPEADTIGQSPTYTDGISIGYKTNNELGYFDIVFDYPTSNVDPDLFNGSDIVEYRITGTGSYVPIPLHFHSVSSQGAGDGPDPDSDFDKPFFVSAHVNDAGCPPGSTDPTSCKIYSNDHNHGTNTNHTPEPSTYAMFFGGLLGIAAFTRTRRKRS